MDVCDIILDYFVDDVFEERIIMYKRYIYVLVLKRRVFLRFFKKKFIF